MWLNVLIALLIAHISQASTYDNAIGKLKSGKVFPDQIPRLIEGLEDDKWPDLVGNIIFMTIDDSPKTSLEHLRQVELLYPKDHTVPFSEACQEIFSWVSPLHAQLSYYLVSRTTDPYADIEAMVRVFSLHLDTLYKQLLIYFSARKPDEQTINRILGVLQGNQAAIDVVDRALIDSLD